MMRDAHVTTTTPPSTTPRPGTGAETGQPKRRTLFDRAEVRERRRPEPVAEPTDAPPRSKKARAPLLAEVRSPRLVLTVLVGAALAVAGALMQGIFGNPLAEPGSVGVSAGAAVGASFSIL